MLNNQSIPAPSDSGPVEMVSPPIDWAAYFSVDITLEGAFIAGLFMIIIPIIISEYSSYKEFWNDNPDLQ